MEHLFSFRDCCIRVLERGPPADQAAGSLIFLHGRYSASESWEKLVDSLSHRFRCLLVDLPGFGRSFFVLQKGLTFQEHEAFLKKLVQRFAPTGQGGVVLVGHDIGGTLAQLGIRELPDRLIGLVLINSGCLSEAERSPCLGLLRSWRAGRDLEKLLKASRPIAREARYYIERGWRNTSQRSSRIHALEVLSQTWPRQYERQGWRQLYGRTSLPVLLLWGKQDHLNPPEAGFALMQSLKEAKFFELEEIGHWPQLEAPDWVLHKMQEFLFQLENTHSPGIKRTA